MNESFWNLSPEEVLLELGTTRIGLTAAEADRRLKIFGFNLFKPKKQIDTLQILLSQFLNPIGLILLFAAFISLFLHDRSNALIILFIIIVSGLLGFWQEKSANGAIEKLLALVRIKAEVLRNGVSAEIPMEEIVPGDIVVLNAGDSIPGDCLLLESKDLFVSEATLTGETFPVEKKTGILPVDIAFASRLNSLFMGTHVVSGTAIAVVVKTGHLTELGKISERLKFKSPETEFERGIRNFGFFLMEVTLLLVMAIFAINLYLHRPVLESLLFSLALAVGLTPQLLPAIISTNLAIGAKRMAKRKVIVKRLSSIENFGSMDILCSDKTGTLTEGVVQIRSTLDCKGRKSERVLLHAALNAFFENGFTNPIDEAIRRETKFNLSKFKKLDEEPYDFIRKRLSVLVSCEGKNLMVTKGAFPNILSICDFAELEENEIVKIETIRPEIEKKFEELSDQGFRVLGLAVRTLNGKTGIDKKDEKDMTFLGFLVFHDPPKAGVIEAIQYLQSLDVTLKIITGDNHRVAHQTAKLVGIGKDQILTGSELRKMSDEALRHNVSHFDLFAEIDPNQKERIILALKKSGHVVGYLGDGINDASALHAADVGISVDQAVDVVKEAAEIVLLEKNLAVLAHGVREGRQTFGNTLKYIFMATSANFGNMFSMAGASLFLPFLPLLPKQILLTNLLTDLPEMTIATDEVDAEMTERPRRWNIIFIRRFMITFGLLSSIFDYLTFGILFWLLKAGEIEFRTGWFVESVLSASFIVLVIRTTRSFLQSRPSRPLWIATFSVGMMTVALPFTPLAHYFGFCSLPLSFLLALGFILILYIGAAEAVKKIFYRKTHF